MIGSLDLGPRQNELTSAKPVSLRANTNSEGVWGPQALYSGSPLGVMATTAADALVPPELMVAEQVEYWISKDVQNAELTFDGLDGLPVEVSITLQGKEAHVDFRTDQDGIRDRLQNTESHLKEMLAKEGLILLGVSVGASKQEERGSPGGKEPQTKRRAEITVDLAVPGQKLHSPLNVEGKSIDVFV